MRKPNTHDKNQLRLDLYIERVDPHPHPRENKLTVTHHRKPTEPLSRENSEREEMSAELQDYPSGRDYRSRLHCPAFVMIAPCDTTFWPTIQRKLIKLIQDYTKTSALKFIAKNMEFHGVNNITNLESIIDTDFWEAAMPTLLHLLSTHLPKISSTIQTLPCGYNSLTQLTRLQLLLILGCMFLGIMPKQQCEESTTFGELMTLRNTDTDTPHKAKIRIEKLRCIMCYFKIMLWLAELFDEEVQFQRTSNSDRSYLDENKMDGLAVPLRGVQLTLLGPENIEDYYCRGLMIDFANKKIGGGVLRNGCVQEEILFTIFPETIVAKLLCEDINEDEAIIISGARRMCKYSGYADTFKFEGAYEGEHFTDKSVLIAIDATDFSRAEFDNMQYSKKHVRREINKAFAGFAGAAFCVGDESTHIITGKWGCGIFKGDEQLKFLIQWIATSEACRQMIYLTDTTTKCHQYQTMVDALCDMNTLDLLNVLDEYYKFRCKAVEILTLFEYIQEYVL